MAKRKKSTFERLQNEPLNRKQRRELGRRLESRDPGLEVVHRDAAAVDAGSKSHFVAVPPDRDERPVREFGSWTAALREMAQWLKQCGIRTVVMQSTGVYWIGLQEVLEAEGLEVFLVNARATKNLPGRKSDVQECQWLLKLHTYGLLRNSFRPPPAIRAVRTLWRQRQRLVEQAGETIQQMQKALITMNVQLSNTISDISGTTGMAIIRAILRGERDPRALAQLKDRRIGASEAEIAASLEGNWNEEVLFELRQVVETYDHVQRQIFACDQEVHKRMEVCADADRKWTAEELTKKSVAKAAQAYKPRRKNDPHFDLGEEQRRIMGVDGTGIDGMDVLTWQVIIAEVGTDLSAFPSEDHFAAWAGLSPRPEISGGKVIRYVKSEGSFRVGQALRLSAQSLSRSNSYLGARYRSLRGRLGPAKATKAMARYLACLVYRLLTKGKEYVDRGAAHYERKREERELLALQHKAASRGMRLVPVV
jgi:transposase